MGFPGRVQGSGGKLISQKAGWSVISKPSSIPCGVAREDFQTTRACAVRFLFCMRISMEVPTPKFCRARNRPPWRLSITVWTLSQSVVEEEGSDLPTSKGTRKRMRPLRRREGFGEGWGFLISFRSRCQTSRPVPGTPSANCFRVRGNQRPQAASLEGRPRILLPAPSRLGRSGSQRDLPPNSIFGKFEERG